MSFVTNLEHSVDSDMPGVIPKMICIFTNHTDCMSFFGFCHAVAELFACSLQGNFVCILSSADFFQNQLFQKIRTGMTSGCQTAWIQIRPIISSGLIWAQTTCKGYQQMTLVQM